jgi:signal transduction histidine kinase
VGGHAGVEIGTQAVGEAQVRGSAVLLGQVVRNLLENACRHAASTVVVSVTRTGGDQDGQVELEVADDGRGIAVDDRARVFERFVRLDDARARDEGGSGLGLAIVRKIVDSSGGTVEIGESASGGARFIVRLPAVSR